MTDNLSFINSHWFWQIVIIILAIWLVFIWKERTKIGKRSFYVNCTVAFIALLSLALLALKPTTKNLNKSFKAVILTNGFNDIQLDSLKKVYKKMTVYNYKENQTLIPKEEKPETVFVLGNGLQYYDLWQLDSINTIYIGGSTLKGISQFKYNIENTVGNDAKFSGQYLQPAKGYKLLLADPTGRALDSIILTNNYVQDFQLTTNLKVKGEFVYQLIEKDSLDNIINQEPLPLIVQERELLNVLIVNASPSFETKYLKNYLAESGYKILVRSRLTKDRYKYEYFNMDSKPRISFTQESLKFYDLVIIDVLSLNSLSNSAKNTLETSIKEDGLGIFIQPGANIYNSHNNWYSFNFTSDNQNTTSLGISTKSSISKYPFVFKNHISIEPVLSDNSNILSAYKRFEIGRIGTSVLQNTFELQLKGDHQLYKQVWSKIIESISKKDIPSVKWNSNSQIAYQNEPFNFKLRTIEANPIITTQGYQIPMKRDINIESLWEGITYPKKIGWNTINIKQDSTNTFKYFVTDNTHWQSVKTFNTIKTNKKYFEANNWSGIKTNTLYKPIHPLWFFVIFIICIGYLWLEPKL